MNHSFKKAIRQVAPAALLLSCALFFAPGCQFYKDKDPNGLQNVDRNTVSYRIVMQNILSTRCISCHANDFSSYDAIRALAKDIQYHALDKRDMPPNAPLSSTEARVLQLWLDAGMPLNPGEASAPLPTIEPTFVSIRDNIFTPHCVKCHGQGADHDDIDIFNLDTLTGPKGWVVPSDPDKSELYQDLIKTGKGRMPPLKTGPGLPADQIDVIRTWILNGAKD